MIRNGKYSFGFGTVHGRGTAEITMTDGRFEGSTNAGAHLEGTCRYEPARNLITYELTIIFPPHHTTVTGLTTGAEGRRILVVGEKSLGLHGNRFSFGLAGRAIDVVMYGADESMP